MIPSLTSLQHPLVKHLVRLREDRRYRKQSGTLLLSGIKLIQELAPDFPIKTLLITCDSPPPPIAAQTYCITEAMMKKITGLQNPEPLAAEIPLPLPKAIDPEKPLLILDALADPGNVGTLLRTALALGWDNIFLTPHTADPFNEKALRAAKGATFRLNLHKGSYEALGALLGTQKRQLFIADARGKKNIRRQSSPALALVLGNESHGIDPRLMALGTPIAIPMNPLMESLNVSSAGAILMFELYG